MEKRLVITNHSQELMLLFTEPEAQDYWLNPGESVELRADVSLGSDGFELEQTTRGITVWPSSGMGYISTWSKGLELTCGYQRPEGDW